ncbi:polysaccharide pyruvyl transferase family protein [Flavitalea flava]
MNDYIALLDPSLRENDNSISFNLGDVIIFKSIIDILETLFPHYEIKRISTHFDFGKNELALIKNARLSFVGGTNLLTSDIRHFSRFTPVKNKFFYLNPGFKNVILIGTGWSSYAPPPDLPTSIYYQRVLHKRYAHSLRDGYSKNHLKKALITNTINTSCPTTWDLDSSFENKYGTKTDKILFTLTDYNQDSVMDNQLLSLLIQSESKEVFFFPQGKTDLDYIESLDTFKKNKTKFSLLNHRFDEFDSFIKSNRFNYIGTRLHAGIAALKEKNPALIISIDNRAEELAKDIQLNVINRKNLHRINDWIQGKYSPPPLLMPGENIKKWKIQFKEL